MQAIQLREQQQEHADRLTRILSSSKFALDLSVMGAGKTYTSSHIALHPDFSFGSVIVICPKSVQHKWSNMAKDYGVPLEHNLTYETLRSCKDRQPSHGLLSRTEEKVRLALVPVPVPACVLRAVPALVPVPARLLVLRACAACCACVLRLRAVCCA